MRSPLLRRSFRPWAAGLLLVALCSAPAAAQAPQRAVLGDGGALYVATAGSYGDLFPGGKAYPAKRSVLVLDLLRPGAERERQIVPGTGGPATDGSPALVYEETSKTLYVIWESRNSPEVSELDLASLGPDGWTQPVEISGDVTRLKGAPKVVISRDEYEVPDSGDPATRRVRTVLHVVWWEASEDGDQTFYTPVVLDNGEYLGFNPVYQLSGFAPAPPDATKLPDGLTRSPSLTLGPNGRSAILGFVDDGSARLRVAEAVVLPGELGYMADRGAADLEASGKSPFDKLLDKLRGQIIEIGDRLHPGIIDHFAKEVVDAAQNLHDEEPGKPVASLGDKLRGQIIEIGARSLIDIDRPAAPLAATPIELAPPDGSAQPPELIELRLVTDLPAPPAVEGAAQIFLSADGRRVLVSWSKDDQIFYTESTAETGEDAWSEPKRLVLDDSLAGVDPAEILQARVRQLP